MTKSDLINQLGRARGISAARAESIVNAIFDSIEATLRRGERIEIRGFGSFEIRKYRAYSGRNPRNGTKVAVAAKHLPFFKVGKEMKDRINRAPLDARVGSAGQAATAAQHQPSSSSGSASSPLSEATAALP
jgi:integration host factor subunit beta